MDLRNDDLEKRNLNLEYKNKANEEKFLDDMIRASEKETDDDILNNNTATLKPYSTNGITTPKSDSPTSTDTSKKKITRDEIINSVIEQAKKFTKDDPQQVKQEKAESRKVEYSDVAKTINWASEYSKQPIEINEKKIRKYLKFFNDLPELIKLREKKIISGEVKPESNYLEINQLPNLDFLKGTKSDNKNLLVMIDYKMQEMDFYHRNLTIILAYLKNYMYMGYQFLMLKYCYKFSEKDLRKVTNFKNLENLDNVLIDYIYKKLVEEANN